MAPTKSDSKTKMQNIHTPISTSFWAGQGHGPRDGHLFSKSVVTVVAGPEMIKKSDDGESFDRVFPPVRIRVSISHSFGSVCKASLDIVSIEICTPVCCF